MKFVASRRIKEKFISVKLKRVLTAMKSGKTVWVDVLYGPSGGSFANHISTLFKRGYQFDLYHLIAAQSAS